MSKYVKLRDKGTIFHDASHGVTVTGVLPVLVKKTAKVTTALRSGILIEVAEAEAKKLLADAAGTLDQNKKKAQAGVDSKVAELTSQLAESNAAKEKATADLGIANAALATANSQVAAANAAVTDAPNMADYVLAANSVPKASYAELAAKLASTEDVLKETKAALAKAKK